MCSELLKTSYSFLDITFLQTGCGFSYILNFGSVTNIISADCSAISLPLMMALYCTGLRELAESKTFLQLASWIRLCYVSMMLYGCICYGICSDFLGIDTVRYVLVYSCDGSLELTRYSQSLMSFRDLTLLDSATRLHGWYDCHSLGDDRERLCGLVPKQKGNLESLHRCLLSAVRWSVFRRLRDPAQL